MADKFCEEEGVRCQWEDEIKGEWAKESEPNVLQSMEFANLQGKEETAEPLAYVLLVAGTTTTAEYTRLVLWTVHHTHYIGHNTEGLTQQ